MVVPAGERRERADRFDVHVSGTEANVADTLARLGDVPSVDADELDRLVDAPGGRIER